MLKISASLSALVQFSCRNDQIKFNLYMFLSVAVLVVSDLKNYMYQSSYVYARYTQCLVLLRVVECFSFN